MGYNTLSARPSCLYPQFDLSDRSHRGPDPLQPGHHHRLHWEPVGGAGGPREQEHEEHHQHSHPQPGGRQTFLLKEHHHHSHPQPGGRQKFLLKGQCCVYFGGL